MTIFIMVSNTLTILPYSKNHVKYKKSMVLSKACKVMTKAHELIVVQEDILWVISLKGGLFAH